MDEIDRAKLDEWELADPELALAAHDAMDAAPRLSPGARRFMSGEMDPDDARRLGFVACDDDES